MSSVEAENERSADRAPAMGALQRLAEGLVYQITEYRTHGFEICGLVGINRSPSCGVETTTRDNRECEGEGLWIRALREALEKQGIHVAMTGVKAHEIEEAVDRVRRLLGSHPRR